MRAEPRCRVAAWRPDVPGLREVFHARMVDWAYPPHCHDVWTVLILDRGAIRYDLDRHHRGAGPATVTVLPPHVVHDGRSVEAAGFTKRVLYVDATLLPDDLIGAGVDRSALDDEPLRRRLAEVHRALVAGDDLDAETHLAFATERIAGRLAPTAADGRAARRPAEPEVARRLRDLLDARRTERVTLRAAADALGRHPTHLARTFSAAFGMSPHAYLVGRRVEHARALLLDGVAPAEVAAAAGFHDQAHLTRHFRRHTATTPARFAHRP